MDVAVRPSAPEEAPRLARLHLRTALEAFAHIFPPDAPQPKVAELTDRWTTLIGPTRPATQIGFVAEQAGSLVGVVVAGPDPEDPRRGHLSRLYVDADHWGRGIRRHLHDRAVAHLRQCDYADLTLWVLEANHRSRSWYERLGWRPTDRRKTVYAPTAIDDVGYRLSLADAIAPGC